MSKCISSHGEYSEHQISGDLGEFICDWCFAEVSSPVDNPAASEDDAREVIGCDCVELCEMGPTCPGGMLARLPGSGCWRTDTRSEALTLVLTEHRVWVEALESALARAEQIKPDGSSDWVKSGIAMRTTVLREIHAAMDAVDAPTIEAREAALVAERDRVRQRLSQVAASAARSTAEVDRADAQEETFHG